MILRLISVLAGAAALAASAGCGGPKALSGCPRPPVQAAFEYCPIEVRPRQVLPEEPPPPPPPVVVVKPKELPLPSGEPGWQVNVASRPWRWIVVHHSASDRGCATAFDEYHRNGRHWDELGYHFVIGNGTGSGDGQVEVGSRWPKQKHGAHCKVGNNEEYNEGGIGICLVGNFEKGRPTAAQLASLARLVDYLAARYKIDDKHIIGHGDVDDTRCPGRGLPLDGLMARINAAREHRQGLARGPAVEGGDATGR